MVESKRELKKEPSDEGERGEWKSWLKTQHSKKRRSWQETVTDFIFLGSRIAADLYNSHEIKKCLLLGRKAVTNLDSILKSKHHFADKIPSSQAIVIPYVRMWELDCKEVWAPKNWCFWTVVLEKTLESPLDSKEIKPVNREGNQLWIFIERTDAEVEAPILWPPDAKSWFIGKDPDAGKDSKQEEKGMIGEEMDGWHHQLEGHEFEQAPRDGEGQGSLVCCSPWGHRVGSNSATEQPQLHDLVKYVQAMLKCMDFS